MQQFVYEKRGLNRKRDSLRALVTAIKRFLVRKSANTYLFAKES